MADHTLSDELSAQLSSPQLKWSLLFLHNPDVETFDFTVGIRNTPGRNYKATSGVSQTSRGKVAWSKRRLSQENQEDDILVSRAYYDHGHVKELTLNYQPWSSLPAGFTALTSLTKLSLNFMGLWCLPDDFGNLENLVDLSLAHNKLESLPKSMEKLTKLEELDLSQNKFYYETPACLQGMVSLKVLDFDKTMLDFLSDWLLDMRDNSGLTIYLGGTAYTEPKGYVYVDSSEEEEDSSPVLFATLNTKTGAVVKRSGK